MPINTENDIPSNRVWQKYFLNRLKSLAPYASDMAILTLSVRPQFIAEIVMEFRNMVMLRVYVSKASPDLLQAKNPMVVKAQ